MKILIMGLGGIGQRHLRNLRKLGGNDLEIAKAIDHAVLQAIEQQPVADAALIEALEHG